MPDNLTYPWQAVGWNPDVLRYLDNAEKVTRTVRPALNTASRASVAIPIALGASRVLPSLTEALPEVATGTISPVAAIPALSLLFAGDTSPRTEEVLSNGQNEYWRNSGIQAGADAGSLEQYLPTSISKTVPYLATSEPKDTTATAPQDTTSTQIPNGTVVNIKGKQYAYIDGKLEPLIMSDTGGQLNNNEDPKKKRGLVSKLVGGAAGLMMGNFILDITNSLANVGEPSTNFGGPWMKTYNPFWNKVWKRKENGWPTTPTQVEDYLYWKSKTPERMDLWSEYWNSRLYTDPYDLSKPRIENPIVYDRNGVRQNTAWDKDGNLISTGPMSNEALKDEEQQRLRDIAEIKKPASGGTTNTNGKETTPPADDDFVSTGNPLVDRLTKLLYGIP